MPALGLEHVGHQVGHRPHALADLGNTTKPARQPDVDIVVLVGPQPNRILDLRLGHHRPGFHHRVNLVTGPVQEPGVDEHDPPPGRTDAGGQVQRRATLLVHDPDLQRVRLQRQRLLDSTKQLDRRRHLVRTMLLRLDDVDTAGSRIPDRPGPLQVMHRRQRCDHHIEKPLGDRVTRNRRHRVGVHVNSDIADQHQAASRQIQAGSVGRNVGAIGVQPTSDRLTTLFERHLQITLHQPQPVGIHQPLVGGVDGRDRILAVLDRRHCRFEHHVLDASPMNSTDRMLAVDHDLDVQPVVQQQHARWRLGRPVVTGQHAGIRQPACRFALEIDHKPHPRIARFQPIGDRIPMTGVSQRDMPIQQGFGTSDHAGSTGLVVPRCRLARLASNHVGAVQRVVKTAPTGVGSVQAIAGVVDRDDQLRPGHRGNLEVHTRRLDYELTLVLDQVPDPGQELASLLAIVTRFPVRQMPLVNLLLQSVATIEQFAIDGPQIADDPPQRNPKLVGVDAGSRNHLVTDQFVQARINTQPANLNSLAVHHALCHVCTVRKDAQNNRCYRKAIPANTESTRPGSRAARDWLPALGHQPRANRLKSEAETTRWGPKVLDWSLGPRLTPGSSRPPHKNLANQSGGQ